MIREIDRDQDSGALAQEFIRTALQIEDEATLIKNKHKVIAPSTISKDLYGAISFNGSAGSKQTSNKAMPSLKADKLTKHEKMLLANVSGDNDASEDAYLAL